MLRIAAEVRCFGLSAALSHPSSTGKWQDHLHRGLRARGRGFFDQLLRLWHLWFAIQYIWLSQKSSMKHHESWSRKVFVLALFDWTGIFLRRRIRPEGVSWFSCSPLWRKEIHSTHQAPTPQFHTIQFRLNDFPTDTTSGFTPQGRRPLISDAAQMENNGLTWPYCVLGRGTSNAFVRQIVGSHVKDCWMLWNIMNHFNDQFSYDIISTLGTGKPNTLNLNSSSVLLTCMNPPLHHIVCNRWLKRPQLIRCFLLAQNSRSKNSFDHWFLVSVRSYAAMAPALWRMNSWCRCGVKGCPSSKSSSAWWFIGSECSCVGNGLLLRSSFTSFAIHLLNLSLWLQRQRFRRAKFVLRCYSTCHQDTNKIK